MVDEKQLQEVNITDLWNKNIYSSLERLQDFERIVRDGAVSITEYLNISPQRMPEIQFQYLKMIITEMGILLANAKERISKPFYLKTKIQLRKIKETVDLNPQSIFVSSINQQSHTTTYYLSEQFYIFLSTLSSFREGIVTQLADVLYGKPVEKAEGMDKEQLLK